MATWSDLADEFDRWGEAGRIAALWWRDDDAIAATPQLEHLFRLAGDTPVALAVIPALAQPELAEAVAGRLRVAVLQHGWQHANHAEAGQKKSEYPEGRSPAEVGDELAAGKARLAALFGGRALPVLVPPWNRFAPRFLPLLADLGIAGLSAMSSTRPATRPMRVAALDVHADLVAWKAHRGFVGESAALGALTAHLRAARRNADAPRQPIGILTHHLVMDAPAAAFIERLTALTHTHPAVRWTAVAELLQ